MELIVNLKNKDNYEWDDLIEEMHSHQKAVMRQSAQLLLKNEAVKIEDARLLVRNSVIDAILSMTRHDWIDLIEGDDVLLFDPWFFMEPVFDDLMMELIPLFDPLGFYLEKGNKWELSLKKPPISKELARKRLRVYLDRYILDEDEVKTLKPMLKKLKDSLQ